MEKEKKLDRRCIVSPGSRLQFHGHLRTGDRLCLGADSKQRQTRRRCHTVLSAYSAAGDYLRAMSVRLRGNLLCRADWLCLRPPDAAPANKPSSGKRPTARRSLLAPELVNKICWQPAEKSPRSSAREEKRRIRRRRCTIPAAVLRVSQTPSASSFPKTCKTPVFCPPL